MMLAGNVLREKLLVIISAILLLILIVYNYVNISSVSGLWVFGYAVTIFFISIWLTCIAIQHLLGINSPLKYETLEAVEENTLFNILGNTTIGSKFKQILSMKNKVGEVSDCVDYDTTTLSLISSSIEKKFVSSWYPDAVSKEISFPFSCKELLDQVTARFVQVCKFFDTVDLTSEAIIIFLRHYKEYKRAQKRMEKSGRGKLEDFYKYAHPTSFHSSNNLDQKNCSPEDYCMILVRSFLKELLPWELWGTPHSFLLSSIIAKKMNTDICNSYSDPKWLKKCILLIIGAIPNKVDNLSNEIDLRTLDNPVSQSPVKEEIKMVVNVSAKKAVEMPAMQTIIAHKPQNVQFLMEPKQTTSDFSHSPNKTSVETVLTSLLSQSTAPVLQRAEINTLPKIGNDTDVKSSNSPKHSQPIDIRDLDKKPKSFQEVKIYDKINENNIKTWNTDVDLDCVSLGQDLLETLDGEMDLQSRLGRLWEADNMENSEGWSPNPPSANASSRVPHALWFGEEDIDMELNEDSPPKSRVGTSKPVDPLPNFSIANIHNMKDLQNISKTTVNQAKHKIGDLQDEAAGVMEGILDFGIAGIKKGLRMTGLDSVQDAPKIALLKEKQGQQGLQKASLDPLNLAVERNDNYLDLASSQSPGFQFQSDSLQKAPNSNIQHLVKQQRVASQDSLAVEPNLKMDRSQSCTNESIEMNVLIQKQTSMSNIPGVLPVLDADSPEFEYEENADFATTIAKLRSLLQQKSCDVTPK